MAAAACRREAPARAVAGHKPICDGGEVFDGPPLCAARRVTEVKRAARSRVSKLVTIGAEPTARLCFTRRNNELIHHSHGRGRLATARHPRTASFCQRPWHVGIVGGMPTVDTARMTTHTEYSTET